MKYRKIYIFLLLFCLSNFSYSEEQQLVPKQKYEWVVEEILQQLTELRKEVNSMKKDVTALNEKFDALTKNAQRGGKAVPHL